MKKNIILGVAMIVFGVMASTAFAAGTNASFGSVGQRASDASSFGISVCNEGSAAITSPVPVTIVANNVSVAGTVGAPIAAGSCSYTYFPYSSFAMIGGAQYSVTASASGIVSASYVIHVPGAVLGASVVSPSQGNIDLMANEVTLIQDLIALIQSALGK